GVKGVIDFFHETDERTDIVIAQSRARIVPLELFDQPTGIVNPDVKLVVGGAQKCPGKFTQFERRFTGQDGQLRAATAIDQAVFEIDSDLRVSALEKFLDLTEERFVHKTSDGRASSSR